MQSATTVMPWIGPHGTIALQFAGSLRLYQKCLRAHIQRAPMSKPKGPSGGCHVVARPRAAAKELSAGQRTVQHMALPGHATRTCFCLMHWLFYGLNLTSKE